MLQYRTKNNEMLDAICCKIYGKTENLVERVLAINPHLADYGAILPENLILHLPPISNEPTMNSTIKLWD